MACAIKPKGCRLLVVIRTAVVTLAAVIRDLVRQLVVQDAELDVFLQLDDRGQLENRLRDAEPDLVLIGLRPGESEEITLSILAAVPDASVIAFASHGRSAFVAAPGARCTTLREFSPEEIKRVIRNIRPGKQI